MSEFIIETERLVIRLPQPGEGHMLAEYFFRNYEFFANRDVAPIEPYLSGPYWEEQIKILPEALEERRSARLICVKRENGEMVGRVTCHHFALGPASTCHIGYTLDRAFEGQGYMAEALRAFLPAIAAHFGTREVVANVLPGNLRSLDLLSRLGFKSAGYSLLPLPGGDEKKHFLKFRLDFDAVESADPDKKI